MPKGKEAYRHELRMNDGTHRLDPATRCAWCGNPITAQDTEYVVHIVKEENQAVPSFIYYHYHGHEPSEAEIVDVGVPPARRYFVKRVHDRTRGGGFERWDVCDRALLDRISSIHYTCRAAIGEASRANTYWQFLERTWANA